MSAYTEQYEIALRAAQRELRDSLAIRRTFWLAVAGCAFLTLVLTVASVWLWYLEHLVEYTPQELQAIARGGQIGVHFVGAMGLATTIAALVAGGSTWYLLSASSLQCQCPSRKKIRQYIDAVEDAQIELDKAIRHEEEEAVKQYTVKQYNADTRTHLR